MIRNELYELYWINHNEKKSMYDSISNVIYNTKVLPWKNNKLNYYIICGEKLDNSSENIVILPNCDSIVHELCIKKYFIEKKKKIDCYVCDDEHSFTLKSIKNTTEGDERLFDSKDLTNMIELNTTNDDLKTICIPPLRRKFENFRIIQSYYNKIVSKINEKITFHVFDSDYPITYYFIYK
jgi:hypothetical protein